MAVSDLDIGECELAPLILSLGYNLRGALLWRTLMRGEGYRGGNVF